MSTAAAPAVDAKPAADNEDLEGIVAFTNLKKLIDDINAPALDGYAQHIRSMTFADLKTYVAVLNVMLPVRLVENGKRCVELQSIHDSIRQYAKKLRATKKKSAASKPFGIDDELVYDLCELLRYCKQFNEEAQEKLIKAVDKIALSEDEWFALLNAIERVYTLASS